MNEGQTPGLNAASAFIASADCAAARQETSWVTRWSPGRKRRHAQHPSGSLRTKLAAGYGLACCLLLRVSFLAAPGERHLPEVLAKDGTPGTREYAGPPGGEMLDFGFDCELLASIPKQKLAEHRAWHGRILIGRVNNILDAADRLVIAGANPEPEFSYYVRVEQTLSGDANGTIGLVATRPPGFEPCDHAGPGALQPGKRSLLFAGKDPFYEEYLVTAGAGAILHSDDNQDADLVRKCERRFIPTAEAWQRQQIELATATTRGGARRALVVTPTATP